MKLNLQKLCLFLSKYSIYILSVLISLFIVYYYSPIVLHPSKYILNDKGDAIKNYFCYEWHVQNDTSTNNYIGTNYPYGEHHGYTDGNPLLSNSIRLFSFLKPYSIPIFNITLMLSFVLCSIILFKIFKLFELSDWFSTISSLGVTILCPQVFRIGGHFALSYSFCLPLTIYILLKHQSGQKNNYYTFLLFLTLTLLFFVHPYLGMICNATVFLFWIFEFFFDLRNIRIKLVHFFIQAIFPSLIYLIYIKTTDIHPDRSSDPYGFLYFTAKIETVFISTLPPFRHILSQIYKIKGQNWEGIAYVGVTSLLAILFSFFLVLKRRNEILNAISRNSNYRTLFLLILSSFVLLLFSMGYPFKWNLENLLDYFSFVKQFRAPGRFAWAFYFITTLFSAILISKYFIRFQNKFTRNIICSSILLLFVVEGIPYHTSIAKNLFVPNCFDKRNLSAEFNEIIKKANELKAQAIIPLPFFHIGSDYYYWEGTQKIKTFSFILSYHSKIPLTACLTPRASISESRNTIQLFGNNFENKELENKIPMDKPFLILFSKENLNDDESIFLSKGELIFESENYILKKISPKIIFANKSEEKIKFFNSHKDSLIYKQKHYITSDSYFQYINYDSLSQKIYSGLSNKPNLLFEIPKNSLEKNKEYEISFWYYSNSAKELFNILKIQEQTSDSLVTISERNINSMPNTDGHRTLAKLSFVPKNNSNKIEIILQSSDKIAENHFSIDNLLIRRKDIKPTEYYPLKTEKTV
jgi:hypothetical protein